MNNTLDIINLRSSIRKYKDQNLPEDLLKILLEAGLRAPTATNKQEIHISVVKKDHPVLKQLQNDLDSDSQNTFYYDAPVVLFISALDDFKWSDVDAGIAIENIHLAATSLELGSLIIGCVKKVLDSDKKDYYNKQLCIPEGYSFKIALAVGYPDTEKQQHLFNFDEHVTFVE